MKKEILPGPVAIGGVGGSGTRVFAEILNGLGFYIGDCLNKPSDNLWFTLLFKRPNWFFQNQEKNEKEIYRAIRIFDKAMTTGLASTADQDEIIYVRNAGEEISSYPQHMGANHDQAENILKSRPPEPSRYIGWGWKEPNTHVFLKYLATFIPNFRYIHVLRHGLDMAYSTNHQQLLNWGTLYCHSLKNKKRVTPQDLLRYWVEANNHTVEVGRTMLGERFLVIRLEDLCRNPKASIKTMVNFVGVKVDAKQLNELSRLPVLPVSSGRYRYHDLRVFPTEDIEAVRNFGFEILKWSRPARYIGLAIKTVKRFF